MNHAASAKLPISTVSTPTVQLKLIPEGENSPNRPNVPYLPTRLGKHCLEEAYHELYPQSNVPVEHLSTKPRTLSGQRARIGQVVPSSTPWQGIGITNPEPRAVGLPDSQEHTKPRHG